MARVTYLPCKLLANFRQLTELIVSQKSAQSTSLSTSRLAPAAYLRQTRGNLPRSDRVSGHLSPVQSTKTTSPHEGKDVHNISPAVRDPPDPDRTTPKVTTYRTPALVKPTKRDYEYECTVCKNHSFRHRDGWKKHENEHETKYVCMLEGLFEDTEHGRRCVLCGALNQADSHHLAHNIAPCVEAAKRPSFKRRYDMVGHLELAHNISNGGVTADKWRRRSSKKAWSCGFCIQLFPSLRDRLKHIGTEHFEKGQRMNEWEFTNVIQGLLLQPEIREAWQHLLGSLDPFGLSETKWSRCGNENLQHRLETECTGKETPKSLAQAAYDSAEYDWSLGKGDAAAAATTTNMLPNQSTSESSSPQLHAFASDETQVQHQTWSSPQHQVSQIPRNTPASDAQRAYGTTTLRSSPARLVPALDYGPVWEPLASDTDDLNSTQPTTPFNDNKFYGVNPSVYAPWSGYDITPDPTHGDQEMFYHKSRDKRDWSAIPHPDIDVGGSTCKRLRDSASPPAGTHRCETPLMDKPRKKKYRKGSRDCETALGSLVRDYEQRKRDDDGETRKGLGIDGYLEDGLYE